MNNTIEKVLSDKLNESRKLWREKNKDRIKEYRKKYNNSDAGKKHRNEYACKTNKQLRKLALNKISDFNNKETQCFVCGDKNLVKLTIGSMVGSGITPVEKPVGQKYYRNIINGKYNLGEFAILCYNCLMCRTYYGKYPHEITIEEFVL